MSGAYGLYKIAVGRNTEYGWEFERLATPEEMFRLRPMADGMGVESYGVVESPVSGKRIESWTNETGKYKLLPGFKYGIRAYYLGDIIRVWEYKDEEEPELDRYYDVTIEMDKEFGMLVISDDNMEFPTMFAPFVIQWYSLGDGWEKYEVIGSIYQEEQTCTKL